MERDQIDETLKRIFSDLIDEPYESITYASSPETLEKWDSLAHINLIAAVEEEFGFVIPPEKQLDMLTFELVGDVLNDLLEAKG